MKKSGNTYCPLSWLLAGYGIGSAQISMMIGNYILSAVLTLLALYMMWLGTTPHTPSNPNPKTQP